MSTKTSDTEAMALIHQILDGNEHDSDTTSRIVEIVQMTGRDVAEPGEHSREQLIEMLREDMLTSIAAGSYMNDLLQGGFKGFDNMSYSELLADAREAGLIDDEED